MVTLCPQHRILPSTPRGKLALVGFAVALALVSVATRVSAQQQDIYGVNAARAHAAPYANPDYYIQPAVVDVYQDIFLGRPTAQTNPMYNTGDSRPMYTPERQTVSCFAGDCSPPPKTPPVQLGLGANDVID